MLSYKECNKRWHDKHLVKPKFNDGQKVLLCGGVK